MATFGWARCTDNVADVLRRGAWYRIVEESANGHDESSYQPSAVKS